MSACFQVLMIFQKVGKLILCLKFLLFVLQPKNVLSGSLLKFCLVSFALTVHGTKKKDEISCFASIFQHIYLLLKTPKLDLF